MSSKTVHLVTCSLLVAAALLGAAPFAGAQLVVHWAAFNDHLPSANTRSNVNVYNLRGIAVAPPYPSEGFLKDFSTGDPTPAYIIVTATGVPDYFGTIEYPDPGTPAYALFNGIVDVGNSNSAIGIRASEGTSTTLTVTNLNPSRRYSFRGTSVRGGNYLRRWTLASLVGAESFTDAHTSGVFTRETFPSGTMTNGQAAYDSGENRADGALVGWDDIDPGADGIFAIKCEQYVDDPLPNGETPDLTKYGYAFCAIYLVEMGPPLPVIITSNPPPVVTVTQNRAVRLMASVQGAPAPTYQWFKNDAAIPGATARIFQIDSAQLSDSGAYYLVASNAINQATSTVAQVTVSDDTNGPVLLSAKADDTFQRVILTWDEPVAESPAIDTANYIIFDPSDSVIFVTGVDYKGINVVLHVQTMLTDTNFSLEIDYQEDIFGNPTRAVGSPVWDPDGIATNFLTFAIAPGFTRFQAFLDLPADQSIDQFVAMPIYPDGATFSYHTNVVNWPQTTNPNIDQYAMRFTGLFIAPESGTHRFDPGHDDDARLRIYASDGPSGAFAELLESYSSAAARLTGGPTLDVELVAGQRYYYELIVREFRSRDHAGIGVTMPSGAVSAPISSQFLAIGFNGEGASVTITQQPAHISFVRDPGVSLMSEDFNASNGGFTVTTPLPYDGPWVYNSSTGTWQQNGQPGQNGPNRANTSLLDSPALTVSVSGEVILSFEHRYSFERPDWDGGQVRVSVNGGPFTIVPVTAFTSNGYTGVVRPTTSFTTGQPAFIGESPGFVFITSVANLGAFNTGDVIRVEFVAGNDPFIAGPQTPNWEINAVQLIQGASLNVAFSVRASGMNESGTNPPQAYQWFRNDGAGFVPIFGANGASYTFAPQASDNGAQFRVVVYIPGANSTSTVATLTVGAGSTLRFGRSGGDIILSWDAPARLQCTTILTPPIVWKDVDTGGATSFTVNPSNEFSVSLDAAQEPPPRGTGTGSGTITLSNNILKVDVVYSGLSGNRTADHFHAPAGRGTNASAVYDLGPITTGTTAGAIQGNVTLVDGAFGGKNIAAQLQDIRNQLWYLNIHSSTFPGGEIRGQVEPATRFYRLISP